MVTFIEDESNRWALGIEVFSLDVLWHKVFKPYYHKKSNTTMWKNAPNIQKRLEHQQVPGAC